MNYAETVHKKSLVAYIAFPDDQETISLKRVKSFYWDRVFFFFPGGWVWEEGLKSWVTESKSQS